MAKTFDLVVIGAGPGGYVAAIRAAQLGFKVGIVDKRKSLGGTCLNVGCIPSKALLDSSEKYYEAANHFDIHGIGVKGVSVNLKQMIKRKNAVVDATTKGIDYLMSKNKIDVFTGTASFVSPTEISVKNGSKKQAVSAKKFIIATGSEPTPLPPVPFDGKRIISSTEALDLTTMPKHLIIVGGGVIGVEMGSIFARLGSEVSVVEFMDSIIPTMDKGLGKALQRSLKKIGMAFHLKTKVTGAKATAKGVTLTAEDAKGKEMSLKGDYVLVAIGRRPFTQDLGLEKIGLSVSERGQIPVNANFQTAVPTIYAIGDVIEGPMLAHKASEEGVVCVEKMVGQKPHLDMNTIPGVVYTWPEVASVGQTEEQLKAAGQSYKTGQFPFKASGRARAAEESDGFIKVLADSQTDEILGIHMIGPRAADMIGSAVTAMEYRASAEDIGNMVAAHPTYMEALKEAALGATDNRMIHL